MFDKTTTYFKYPNRYYTLIEIFDLEESWLLEGAFEFHEKRGNSSALPTAVSRKDGIYLKNVSMKIGLQLLSLAHLYFVVIKGQKSTCPKLFDRL